MEAQPTPRKKTGSIFVVSLLAIALLGAAGTQWNYLREHPSSDKAWIRTDGVSKWWTEAHFSEEQIRNVRPGMMATVTIDADPGKKIEAFVESINSGKTPKIPVLIRLPQASAETPYLPNARCKVTVDASVSPEMLKAEAIPQP